MQNYKEMEATIAAITATGKGILAADESSGTMEKRLKSVNVASTEEARRDYRGILFSAPGLGEFISGVILFEETLSQKDDSGTPFPAVLVQQGIIPGIKVDKGTVELPGFPGDKVTQGLDGLSERLVRYRDFGAKFAKWRAVIGIGEGMPSSACIAANAECLARYAATCQDQGLVPIVEPEVLMDGNHDIALCAAVTEEVLHTVFAALYRHRVIPELTLLKPNMVLPGKSCPTQASPEEIASETLRIFRRAVPAAVPGVNFLSGGQSDEAATANLNAMNAHGLQQPWALSFSYGRALQAPALKAWHGEHANAKAAQAALLKRARLNSLARLGKYAVAMEQA